MPPYCLAPNARKSSIHVRRFALLATIPLLICFGLLTARTRGWALASKTSEQPAPALARLSEQMSVRATKQGGSYVNMADGRAVLTAYTGAPELVSALQQNQVTPTTLTTADFDEDGVPDLVSGYAMSDGGIVTILRGNVDAIYPHAPEAQARRAAGTFTAAPFL